MILVKMKLLLIKIIINHDAAHYSLNMLLHPGKSCAQESPLIILIMLMKKIVLFYKKKAKKVIFRKNFRGKNIRKQ